MFLPTEIPKVGGDFSLEKRLLLMMVLAKASTLLGTVSSSSGSPQNGSGPLFLDTNLGLLLLVDSGKAFQLPQGVHPTQSSCPTSQPW